MPNATMRANAQALPEATEPAAEHEDYGDQEAFSQAYARWLRACAQIEDPGTDDEQIIKTFFDEERAAQRALFGMPAVCREDLWNKFEVFEVDLAREQVVGPHKDSILMLALGSIKADLMNLGVGEEV